MYLIDTHTHFDVSEYDKNRLVHNHKAHHQGVRHLLLIGILARYFDQMLAIKQNADNQPYHPKHHLAFGLHPLYIQEQSHQDLVLLDTYLKKHGSIAIGEIGLDTYPNFLKDDELYQKQRAFFIEQIQLAKNYDLPILLHIRKAHGDVLKILKAQKYHAHQQGGIAHSFSGGENEALSFASMGFKIGITGQITNPNAKKLHRSVKAVFDKFGVSAFVIETDCPDMMPIPCQTPNNSLNEPANLLYVITHLAKFFGMDKEMLAMQLWQNTTEALNVHWTYPVK